MDGWSAISEIPYLAGDQPVRTGPCALVTHVTVLQAEAPAPAEKELDPVEKQKLCVPLSALSQ